jgi:MFS family permease
LAEASTETAKRTLLEDLKSIGDSPRELWIVLLAKYLESTAYFSMIVMVTLWLSNDFGYTDIQAGWWFGVFSLVTSLLMFVIGFVTDSMGFRTMLILGFATSAVARGMMSWAPNRMLAVAGLMALTFGTAAGIPVMNTAIRRYSTKQNRSFAFSLYYLSFNFGAMSAGGLVDWCRNRFKAPGGKVLIAREINLPIVGPKTMTAYGLIFLIGFVCAVLSVGVALSLRASVDLDKDTADVVAPDKKNPIAIAIEVMREKAFWRFMLFISLLVLVRLIFTHYHSTWPKYVVREMGENFPLGKVYAINPLVIIFLVPVATALTRHRSAFRMIVAGSFVTASSVFVLCFGASYTTIVTMIVLLSIGEAVWSPRFYEYVATIAPRGREASYMGMSQLPTFVAKLGAGPMSGYLLAAYCPEHGARRSWILWLVVGITTIAGPILMVLLRNVIEGGQAEQKDAAKDEPTAAAA